MSAQQFKVVMEAENFIKNLQYMNSSILRMKNTKKTHSIKST